MQKRQTWSSTLTYILTVAGATIGFGATWRFPYLVGENGGAAFVLVFCVAMIAIGIPVILVENVIGRRAQKNSVDAFAPNLAQDLGENSHLNEKSSQNLTANSRANSVSNSAQISSQISNESKAWRGVGYLGLLGSFGIMAYYMVLGGWVLVYIYNLIFGDFNLSSPVSKEYTSEFYAQNIEHNPLFIGIFTALFVLLNYVILKKGIINGIEKAVKFLMPLLFLCLIIVIIL